MKKLVIVIIAVFSMSFLHGQITGEGKVETFTYSLDDIYRLQVDFNVDIFVDMDMESQLIIMAQSNIADMIGRKVRKGVLTIDQNQWIEATKPIKIIIGAPHLREAYTDSHSQLVIENIKGGIFKVEAELGEVILSGEVEDLRIKAADGRVDASGLKSISTSVSITEDGRVTVNSSEQVECNILSDGRVENKGNGGVDRDCKEVVSQLAPDPLQGKYFDLKIKNNSWSRNHFVVVGPKQKGGKFSYGFSMMPGTVKSERWTVGTKIYKEKRNGSRELLVTLSLENEGQVVKLF